MIVPQPGPTGWDDTDWHQVGALLQPISYSHYAKVATCIEKWKRFAGQGEGYREGPPMPGGDVKLSFHDESWEGPEEDDSSPETVQKAGSSNDKGS